MSLFFSLASFAQLDAANNSGTIINDTSRTMVIQDILAKDTLNGLPVSLSQITITQVSSTNNFVSVNATGSLVFAGSALSGTYNAEHQICQCFQILSKSNIWHRDLCFQKYSNHINTIEVADILEKTLISKTVHRLNAAIDLSSLEKGIYLISLKPNDGRQKSSMIAKV